MDAAMAVRDDRGSVSDVGHLFTQTAKGIVLPIEIEAEMLVPGEGSDYLGQPALAKTTFLSYRVSLRYRSPDSTGTRSRVELAEEHLDSVAPNEARAHLPATLYRLSARSAERPLAEIPNRLSAAPSHREHPFAGGRAAGSRRCGDLCSPRAKAGQRKHHQRRMLSLPLRDMAQRRREVDHGGVLHRPGRGQGRPRRPSALRCGGLLPQRPLG